MNVVEFGRGRHATASGPYLEVSGKQGADSESMALGKPEALGVFIDDEDAPIGIVAAKQDNGEMGEAIVHGGEPLDSAGVIEVGDDVDVAAEGGEELAGGDVPIAIEPGAAFPAREALEGFEVIGVGEVVVGDTGGNENSAMSDMSARGDRSDRSDMGDMSARSAKSDISGRGLEEEVAVPGVADAAGVSSGIDARPPIGPGGAATGGDVLMFAGREGGGLFDADEVVFQAEIGVDVGLILEMAADDARAVSEGEQAAGLGEGMGEFSQDAQAEVGEVFAIGFADFAQQEAFESGDTLAIVSADLSDEPMGFAAASSAAVADGRGAIGRIAAAGGGTGGELPGLEDEAGPQEILDLVARATSGGGSGEVAVESG